MTTAAACALVTAFPGAALAGETQAGAPGSEPDVDRAHRAYDRGVRAHAAGDYAGAAHAFADADAIVPQPASLEAALEAAMRADDALLGAELVDRADGRSPDAGLAKTVELARKRFAGRTGKLRIECPAQSRCLAAVDGAASDARRPIYVAAGLPHAVVVQRGDERVERLVEVRADSTFVVRVGAEPQAPPAAARVPETTPVRTAPSGVSPVWFYVGAGLTAVVGGVTVISGLDAVSKHDSFEAVGCAPGATGARPSDCGERQSEGESAQLRTNILIGATAVLAATTAAIGIFAVRWRDGTQARLTLGSARAAAMAGIEIVTP